MQVLLIVGASVEIHRQQILRRHARTGGIELQLTDGDPGAVSAKVAEAEYPAAVRDADKSDVLLRPIPQDFLDLAAPAHREVHGASPGHRPTSCIRSSTN